MQPGQPDTPGTLHVTGPAVFAAGSTLQIRLNSKTSFDQLVVGNLALLDGATLNVTVNYPAQVGPPPDTLPVLQSPLIAGTFNGLPNANPPTTFTVSGTISGMTVLQRFSITYNATSVVLTRVPGPVTHYQIDTVNTTQAGVPFDFRVTALDAGEHVVTGFTGTVHFSSQDPFGARLPDDYTFTIGDGADNGVHTFSGGATLFTVGTWDITATVLSSGASSSALVSVTPAPAASFAILAPATATAGAAFDVTVAALDPYSNIDSNYQGTVHFSTSDSDPGVVLPPDYTFQAGDSGLVAFPGGVTLITPGDQTVTATDTVSGIGGSVIVTVTVGPVPPPGGGPGGSPGHRPLIVKIPRVFAPRVSNDRAGEGNVPLDSGAVDRVFARVEQDTQPVPIRRRGHGASEKIDFCDSGYTIEVNLITLL